MLRVAFTCLTELSNPAYLQVFMQHLCDSLWRVAGAQFFAQEVLLEDNTCRVMTVDGVGTPLVHGRGRPVR